MTFLSLKKDKLKVRNLSLKELIQNIGEAILKEVHEFEIYPKRN